MFKKINYTIIACFLILLLAPSCSSSKKQQEQAKQPNVLLIISDDLNDWIGCLDGHPQVKTPHIDRLAKRGTLFTNAQCAAPLCGPSRSAFMTGRQPYHTGCYNNNNSHLEGRNDLVSMPQYFIQSGYHAFGAGKLFHSRGKYIRSLFDEYAKEGPGISGGPFLDGELNSELQNPTHKVDRGEGKLKATLPLNNMPNDRPYNKYNTFDWGPVDVTDDEMVDGYVTNYVIDKLGQAYDKPFFIAAGFIRPHQPLYAPRKYHEMYPPESVILPEVKTNDLDDVPQTGKDFGRLAATSGTHKTVLENNQWADAVSSYMACVSFVDAQVGRILSALDNSPYADNTIVVFMGDNGWQLGEKEHWGKWTGWERSASVPLMIIPPRSSENKFRGGSNSNLVSLVDLFPTLIEMTRTEGNLPLDGVSLMPLLNGKTWQDEKPVVTTFGYGNNTIITKKWHYIHYFDGTDELYNLENDPHEYTNLSQQQNYKNVVDSLQGFLPKYAEVNHFIRYGRWKVVLTKDKANCELYDIYTPGGIMDKENVAKQHPEILKQAEQYIQTNQLDKQYLFADIRN